MQAQSQNLHINLFEKYCEEMVNGFQNNVCGSLLSSLHASVSLVDLSVGGLMRGNESCTP